MGGRTGPVGFLRATIRLIGAAPSSSKSLSWLPKGRRPGRSRLVQVVLTDSTVASGSAVVNERSSSEREMSVPSSLGRLEGRRRASQKQDRSSLRAERRSEKKGSYVGV